MDWCGSEVNPTLSCQPNAAHPVEHRQSVRKQGCRSLPRRQVAAVWRLLCRQAVESKIAHPFCVIALRLRANRRHRSSGVSVSNMLSSRQATVSRLRWEVPSLSRRLCREPEPVGFRLPLLFGQTFRGVSRNGTNGRRLFNKQSLKSVTHIFQTLPVLAVATSCSSTSSIGPFSPASMDKAPSKMFPPSSITFRCPKATLT